MKNNEFTIPAFAKINWFLKISGKREDNFHEICTVFQTVSLHDNLTFSESGNLILSCDDTNIPVDERNLIMRAAKLLQEKFSVKKGAEISLEKRIPSPGGLGGGSANAAVTLIGLNQLWSLSATKQDLSEIASKIGADIPFFLTGGTARGFGKGIEIEEREDVRENFLLIVTPDISVSTPDAYRRLNAPPLTKNKGKSIFKFCREQQDLMLSGQLKPENDFEKVIFEIFPEIKRIKDLLLENGAKSALMSGSGASVFGIFEKEETRQATLKAFQKENKWRMFAVATVGREEYRQALQLSV